MKNTILYAFRAVHSLTYISFLLLFPAADLHVYACLRAKNTRAKHEYACKWEGVIGVGSG